MNQDLRFPYGLDERTVRPVVVADGSLSCLNGTLTCHCGSQPASMGAIQGVYPIFLNSDEIEVVCTVQFDADPPSGSLSVIGIGDNECGCMIGYNGTQFGVAVSIAGSMQYYYMAIHSDCAVTGELAFTLNSSTFSIPCNAGDSVQTIQSYIKTCSALAAAGYLVYAVDSGVWIMSVRAVPSTCPPKLGISCVECTVALMADGATPQLTWVFQDEWNGNMVNTDWSRGNMVTIELDPLGFGTVNFNIIEPLSGTKMLLHSFNRRNTSEPFNLPSGLWPAVYCQNLGCTTQTFVSTTGFIITGTNYVRVLSGIPATSYAAHAESLNLTTSNTNIATFTSGLLYTSNPATPLRRNRRCVLARSLFFSVDCSVPCIIRLIQNGSFTLPLQSPPSNTGSCLGTNTDTTVCVAGSAAREYYVVDAHKSMELKLDGISLAPLNTLSITCCLANASGIGATANIGVQLCWSED